MACRQVARPTAVVDEDRLVNPPFGGVEPHPILSRPASGSSPNHQLAKRNVVTTIRTIKPSILFPLSSPSQDKTGDNVSDRRSRQRSHTVSLRPVRPLVPLPDKRVPGRIWLHLVNANNNF